MKVREPPWAARLIEYPNVGGREKLLTNVGNGATIGANAEVGSFRHEVRQRTDVAGGGIDGEQLCRRALDAFGDKFLGVAPPHGPNGSAIFLANELFVVWAGSQHWKIGNSGRRQFRECQRPAVRRPTYIEGAGSLTDPPLNLPRVRIDDGDFVPIPKLQRLRR